MATCSMSTWGMSNRRWKGYRDRVAGCSRSKDIVIWCFHLEQTEVSLFYWASATADLAFGWRFPIVFAAAGSQSFAVMSSACVHWPSSLLHALPPALVIERRTGPSQRPLWESRTAAVPRCLVPNAEVPRCGSTGSCAPSLGPRCTSSQGNLLHSAPSAGGHWRAAGPVYSDSMRHGLNNTCCWGHWVWFLQCDWLKTRH